MNVAEYSIQHRTVSWMVLVLLLVGGALSFLDLGRLEDPPFIRKDAMIVSAYPGATAEEVELELTHALENAIRQMAEVHTIRSTSKPGLSQIVVEMDKEMKPHKIEQVWDKLRRKIADVEPQLPQGATVPRVYDDYGDVYGITLMVTGENYEFAELKQYVEACSGSWNWCRGLARSPCLASSRNRFLWRSP